MIVILLVILIVLRRLVLLKIGTSLLLLEGNVGVEVWRGESEFTGGSGDNRQQMRRRQQCVDH